MRFVSRPTMPSAPIASYEKMFAIQSVWKPCASTRFALATSPSMPPPSPGVAPTIIPMRMSFSF